MAEDWKVQISDKLENKLINARGQTAEEAVNLYVETLTLLEQHKEPIALALAAIAPQRPQPPAPVVPTGPRPIAAPGASLSEIGPLQLEGVEVKKAGRDGVPFKSALYLVKWEGGSATTFDALIGKAALGFWSQGHPCYVTIEPSPKNPKYTNLISIRMAA